MRLFRWLLRSHRQPAELGRCAYCALNLVACSACDGGWRARECACGLGLVCPTHRRYWS